VRWNARPYLAILLFVSGAAAAIVSSLTLYLVVWPLRRAADDGSVQVGQVPSWVFAAVIVAFLLMEVIWVRLGRVRPWAVRSQVPQGWGHRHGPWKAALRYGPRLGLGPATRLNTWAWWAGAAVAALSDLWTLVLFCFVFVSVRTVLTVWLPGNPRDGSELAHRMSAWRAHQHNAALVGLVVMAFSAALLWAGRR
jgi:hypothetical protein